MQPATLNGIGVRADVTATTERRAVMSGLNGATFRHTGWEQQFTLHGTAEYKGPLDAWDGILEEPDVPLVFEGRTFQVRVTDVGVEHGVGRVGVRGEPVPTVHLTFENAYSDWLPVD